MISGVHHVQITVPVGEEERARRFYRDLLGLTEIDKPESLRGRGGFWMQAGDLQVHVGTEHGVDRAASKAHIAYRVVDLERCKRLLAHEGVVCEDGVQIPGFDRCECRDPFGNRLELIQSRR